MKKITLMMLAFIASFSMNAQTQLFFDDFNDEDISDWTQIDEDGDGNVFFAYALPDTPTMTSASWTSAEGPLFPDNYSVSPAIDVTGASGLTLSYQTGGQDPAFSAEVYTVYVSTGNTVADFMDNSITVSLNENLGDDPAAAGALVDRSLDLADLDGSETLYIAFRHHDVSDEFYINFDNVSLTAETLSVGSFENNNLSHFYKAGQLSIQSSFNLDNVSLFNTLGQEVLSQKLNAEEANVNVSNLSTGLYIARVTSGDQAKTFKFVKQ
ncbi:choice-of-anchor J domain-containing protein [Psychroflexus salinarum]|uniref:Choice-of-anchor J domain-containing protein n=1 Tax=Psychroflexus salinarum TaxID=546024 RepID=A0ABW3GUM8_9FLAO